MSAHWSDNFGPDSELRKRVEARVAKRLAEGRLKGLAKYGDRFQGDPIENAFEEACDMAFYLAVELERRAEVKPSDAS